MQLSCVNVKKVIYLPDILDTIAQSYLPINEA